MKVIKKIIVLNMLMLIVIQVTGTAIFNASEIVKFTNEVSENTKDSNSDSEENMDVSAETKDGTTSKSLADVDVSNSLFDGKISYKPASNSGLYTINMNGVNEKSPDSIQGGETITISLTDPVDAPNTCTNPDASPMITPNDRYTEPFKNSLTGELLNDYSADSTSITLTFNDANAGFLLSLGQAVFAWEIDIDDSLRGTDFPCGINTVIADADGTELINNTQEVVFNEPGAVSSYQPVDWSLNDKYAGYDNIISVGSSVSNRLELNSNGYYESNGAEDPKGGIVDNGSRYVGNRISLNVTNGTNSVLSDVQEMSATFTLPQETTLMEDSVHIDAKPSDGSSGNVEITSLLHPGFLTYDDSTKTATFTMTAEDFANVESGLGIDMSDPIIGIYFEEKINKYSVKPQVDNFIYGSASIFDADSWAAEVDALDGYPNEGRVEVEFTDYDDSTEGGSTRLAYQELADSSGVVKDPMNPTLVGTVSDENETAVESNKNSICTPTQNYNFKYKLYDNYVFRQTMGEITIVLPDQVSFNIDDVVIKLNGAEVAHDNEYFTVVQEDNTIVITGTEYSEDNIFEMNYGVIDVSIPVILTGVNVGDSLTAVSSWELFGKTYNTSDIVTSIFDCDVIDPIQARTTITKTAEDASGEGLIQGGEVVTYTLEVTNPEDIDAHNVVVRDSMLEATPSWLTYNEDATINPTDIKYSGSLEDGDLTFDVIEAGETVTITYSVSASQPLPSDVTEVSNIATDNSQDPTIVDPETCADQPEDCDEVVTPLDPDEPIIDPGEAETKIKKTVADTSGEGLIQGGEVVTYTLEVTNPEKVAAHNVVVRDSMLEATPSWLTYNEDAIISPSDIAYSGNLEDGDLTFDVIEAGETVTITYSVSASQPLPSDVTEVSNIATDNGQDPTIVDPETCVDQPEDCAEVVTPLDPDEPIIDPGEAETKIKKTAADASGEGLIQGGEVVTYTLEVTNPEKVAAHNVVVRDSMLEATPSWLTYNEDAIISPSDVAYSGSLEDGDLTFDVIEAGETVTITYSVSASQPLPSDVTEAENVATDNGQDPTIIAPDTCDGIIFTNDECSATVTPVDPDEPIIDPGEAETKIKKTVADASGEGLIQGGEVLTYTLEVTNPEKVDAHNVVVRDSMLEAMPAWLTYNEDAIINPSDIAYSGSLEDGDLTFDLIEAGETVTITYSVSASQPLPTDVTEVSNIATDNGQDPTIVDPDTCDGIIFTNDDCSATVTPLDPDEPIIDPGEAETEITKTVADASGDELIQGGEVLTYTLELTNPEKVAAHNVVVRDSMLEAMPSWLTFNDDAIISPSDVAYSGSLEDGGLTFDVIEAGETVTITYSVSASQPLPTDVTEVSNIATDNGQDPTIVDPDTCADQPEDCDEVVTPLDPDEPIIDPGEAKTEITKSMADSSGDGLIQGGEVLTYTLEVTNPEDIDAHNVVVRDSMLEAMPSWLTFNDDAIISPSDVAYSGSLEDGDLTFDVIEAGETVTITYSVSASQPLPTDVTEVSNIATDNGQDPTIVDPGTCVDQPEDCDEVVTPLDPDEPIIDPGEAKTEITKSMADSSGDGLIQGGEVLTYTLEVTNPEDIDAHNVVVRDSMLEAMPSWLTFNDDAIISPSDVAYSGSLEDGGLTFDVIEAGETVTITYSVSASQPLPSDVTEVSNIATDNGQDPTIVDPETCTDQPEDCAEVVTPLEGDTVIVKTVSDASGDGIVQSGETLAYAVQVTNNTENDAYDVAVRDSLVENTPEWLTFNDDAIIDPSDIAYSGSLTNGNLTFDVVEAGETVTITYSFVASDPLETEVENVVNMATDNGQDPNVINPEVCQTTPGDCAITVTPLEPELPVIDKTEGETEISKSVVDQDGNNILSPGETLTYTVQIANKTENNAYDVNVRDSMIEETPEWLTFNDDATIDPSDVLYSGSLTTGDLIFDVVEAGQTIEITYSLTAADQLPSDVTEVSNIATDDGQDPTDPSIELPNICGKDEEDCDEVTVPLEGNTKISKSVVDENENGILEANETLTYTIEVLNDSDQAALDTLVRDSMIEDMPSWLEFNDDATINPEDIDYSGSLVDGDLTFGVIEAGQTVTITYSMTASDQLPSNITEAVNVATDDGQDPSKVKPEVCENDEADCSIATIVTDGSDVESNDHHLSVTGGKSLLLLFDLIAIVLTTLSLKIRLSK